MARHPGVWKQERVTWVALRAMPATVGSYWPGSGCPPGRSAVYALVERGTIPTVTNPSECRSWWAYDGEQVTAVETLMAGAVAYRTAVVTSKQAQAAIARTSRWPE